MVEDMSVVVNIMLSLMSVMSPPPCLVQPHDTHVSEVMCTLDVFALGMSLVSCIVMIYACVS